MEQFVVPHTNIDDAFTGERFIPGLGGEIELEHVHRYLFAAKMASGKRVLDIASGEGYGSYILAQNAAEVVGLDLNEQAIRGAQKRYPCSNLKFICSNCLTIPYPEESFDLIVSLETIEQIKEQEKFLTEIKRVLRKDGVLVLSTPDKNIYNKFRTIPNERHKQELSQEEFKLLLTKFFSSVILYGQRPAFSSLLGQIDRGSNRNSNEFLTEDGNNRVVQEDNLPSPIYLLALCSEQEIPKAVDFSIYEGNIKPYILSALRAGIEERDGQINNLRNDLHISKEKEINLTRKLEEISTEKSHLSAVVEKENENSRHQKNHIASLENKIIILEQKEREIEGKHRQKIIALKSATKEKQKEKEQQIGQTKWQLSQQEEELAFAREKYDLLQKKYESIIAANLELRRYINNLVSSRSFRFTEPIRHLSSYWRQNCSTSKKLARVVFWAITFRLKKKLSEEKFLQCILNSPLFDAEYYCSQYPELRGNSLRTLVEHYLRKGAKEQRNPHPLFETGYYLQKNLDIAKSGVNPLYHYLESGYREKRNPNRVFRTSFYQLSNPEVVIEDLNPLVHYLHIGSATGKRPHPLFDPIFYLEKHADVKRNEIEPLSHFLRFGLEEKRATSSLFDLGYYSDQVKTGFEKYDQLLDHYLEQGEEQGLNPNPLFDTAFYLANSKHLLNEKNLLLDYEKNWQEPRNKNWKNDPRNPHPLFSNIYYYSENIKLGTNNKTPLAHFFTQGQKNSLSTTPVRIKPFALTIYNTLNKCRLKKSLESEALDLNFIAANNPDVSIIIAAHNKIDYTLRCLKSIYTTTTNCKLSFEVIVINDASSDNTHQILSLVKNIRIIDLEKNLGFLLACKRGAEIARGDYLVFLNNDTCVLPDWLESLVQTFSLCPQAGLVGSKLVYPNGRLQEAGGIIWPDASGWNWGRGQFPEDFRYSYLRDVDYCSGASIMVPKELWKLLGGFDESFVPAYYEDTDLAFKIRAAGYRVLYQPRSIIVHFEGISCGTSTDSGIKSYQLINRDKFLNKWQGVIRQYSDSSDTKKSYLDRQSKGQILIIDSRTPTPDTDSGSNDIWQYFRIFKSLGYHLTFIPENFVRFDPYTKDLEQLGIECVYQPFAKSIENYLISDGARYDLVMLYRAPVAVNYINLVKKHAPQAKIVFDTVDLHFLRLEREALVSELPEIKESARKMRAIELDLIRQADQTILLSPLEKQLIQNLIPEATTRYVPVVREIPGRATSFEERNEIVFIGGFGHPPNIDAVKYLFKDIWPIVRKKLPEVKISIVGSNVTPEIQALDCGDFVIRGHVQNLDDVFNYYRLSVAPLRFGAGMKGKVVSSLSYGVPCVITSVAAEGMGLENGKHALIADKPEEFAEAIVRLYQDRELWFKLSEEGLNYANNNFSVETVRNSLKEMLLSLGL